VLQASTRLQRACARYDAPPLRGPAAADPAMTEPKLPWAPQSLRIVFVCTGNRFRSPLAAAYLKRLLSGLPVEISSCGTAEPARAGVGPLPETMAVARASAVRLADHRTRWVGDVALGDADLVLGFERSHVAAAVLEGGALLPRTFLATELVALLRNAPPVESADPRKRIRTLVEAADRARPRDAYSPEIKDPLGRSRETYERVAIEIWTLTLDLVEAMFTEPPVSFAALPRPRLRHSLRPRWFPHRRRRTRS
jgi:protein-tyrosine phosphatase